MHGVKHHFRHSHARRSYELMPTNLRPPFRRGPSIRGGAIHARYVTIHRPSVHGRCRLVTGSGRPHGKPPRHSMLLDASSILRPPAWTWTHGWSEGCLNPCILASASSGLLLSCCAPYCCSPDSCHILPRMPTSDHSGTWQSTAVPCIALL